MTDKIRVWYVPQIPMKAFEIKVPDVETGYTVLDALTDFSAFEFDNRVKPDYADAGGVQRWESDDEGGHGWVDVPENDDEEQELAGNPRELLDSLEDNTTDWQKMYYALKFVLDRHAEHVKPGRRCQCGLCLAVEDITRELNHHK